MWSKQRPTREGHYWLKWSDINDPVIVRIYEGQSDGVLHIEYMGESCIDDMTDAKFDRARWKPIMYCRAEEPRDV